MSDGTNYLALAAGTTIGPASTYASLFTAGNGTASWRATNTGKYLGVRFSNQYATLLYGWLQLDTTGPTGFPATINSYCYQDDGSPIDAGVTTPVSLQTFSAD